MKTAYDLTLVLPLYNEGPALTNNLETIYDTLQNKGRFSFEIILIDDGSKDSTSTIARMFAEKHADVAIFIQHEKNMGRGGTVMDGFRRGRGTVVGFMDVDCEASPIYILDFVPDLLKGTCDGITGWRVYPFNVITLLRAVMSVMYRQLVYRWLGVGYKDRQSGYKFFRRDKIMPLFQYIKHTHWFWDTEVMVVVHLAGLRIEERPILFFRNTNKKSTVKLFRDSIRMIIALVRFKRKLPEVRAMVQKQRHLP